MSQFSKLLRRILLLDRNMRFDELKHILEYYGYQMTGPRGGSSHKTFRKPGKPPITIPQHEPVKRVYVELVRDIVEAAESEAQNAENS